MEKEWSRTLTGAWIETFANGRRTTRMTVAPSRVRGLKLSQLMTDMVKSSRTLTGAWIETYTSPTVREVTLVAPSRVRGLKLGEVELTKDELLSHPHGCVD